MRLDTYRGKLKRMQNHVSCLQSKAKQLLREQDDVQLQLDVFEGLIAARDAWAGVCKSVLDPEWESDELLQLTMEGADRELQELLRERTHAPEHVLQQLPMLPALSVIDSSLHDSVSRLTPAEAAKQWMSFVEDTASLLTLFDLDAEMASPLLAAHAAHIMAWLLCLYFFSTHVAFELHDINLITGEADPAPEGHWVRAFQAAGFTEQQRRHIAIANQFCVPRLRQLQQEQRALQRQLAELHVDAQAAAGPSTSSSSGSGGHTGGPMSMLGSASQRSGPSAPSLTAHSQNPLPGWASAGPAARPGSRGRGPGKVPEYAAAVKLEFDHAAAVKVEYDDTAASRPAPADAGVGAGTGSGASAAAAAGSAALSRSDSGDGSNHARQEQLAKANELTAKVSANCRAWRIVTSMRAQYSAAVMTPWQVARVALAASPYLLIGAPIYDEIIASNQGVPSN